MDISISTKKINLAFSLCKMTIFDETSDIDRLTRINFVEFIEFIGRIGQIVFIKNKNMNLFDKILYIMQKLFALIPVQVIEPETDYNIDSESDNEEY
jgi:hypothetical protein